MSGTGSPPAEEVPGAERLSVVVIASQWHATIADALLDGARRALARNRVTAVTEVRVPGAFELPVAARRLAVTGPDAIVALGVVIRGGTPHFDYVCQAATAGLTTVAARSGIPIGFGLLTCDTQAQAMDRAGLPGSSEDKGLEATVAALATAVALAGYPRADRAGRPGYR